MTITGETKLIGFFGSSYKTSKMYSMYNSAFAALGLNYQYLPFVVGDLATAVAGVRALGVAAIGITIPYKIEILPFLDELDADAKRIGAVNAVINHDGKLVGVNTDGKGALLALKEKTGVRGKKVVMLGAGGAARAIAFSLVDEGASLVILNRSEEAANELTTTVGGGTRHGTYDNLEKELSDASILIQTTPVGMVNTGTEGTSLVPAALLHKKLVVMEIIGTPKETQLVTDALAAGAAVVYGYRMLLWQGVLKFKDYTGVEPPIAIMEAAMEASTTTSAPVITNEDGKPAVSDNIILYGMKNSGKSTLALGIATAFAMKRISLDDLATDIYAAVFGMRLPFREIAAKHGMDFFRDFETDIVRMLHNFKLQGYVIDCGGGTPLREENRTLLKEMGTMVWVQLDKEVNYERIMANGTPAFFKYPDDPRRSFDEVIAERFPVYKQLADITVPVTREVPAEVLGTFQTLYAKDNA